MWVSFLSAQCTSVQFMSGGDPLCLDSEQLPQQSPHGLGRLPHYDIHNPSPFYRFQQAQPLAISNVATRNINSPVGKMAAMRMPAPMAMANIPMMQFRPPRNTRLRLLSLQPNI